MRKPCLLLVIFLLFHQVLPAQTSPLDRQLFFLDDKVIETAITTDLRKLRRTWNNPVFQPANITMHFSDTMVIKGDAGVKLRGQFRKTFCDLASLMLNFKNPSSPLSPLKELKLVGACHNSKNDEALLIKEYVAYKIYNFITPMSFRVRLLHVTYSDSKEKAKSYQQYAFLIEDVKEVAKRNNCVELKNKKIATEATNRQQINLVSIFEFMIGNTDWAVSAMHNIKLIMPKNDSLARPYVIPYDFDYAGIVNAGYAVPAEELGIKSVTERMYMGFKRNPTELQINLDIFKEKKEQVMFYVRNLTFLGDIDKKNVVSYLDDFFKILDSKKSCRAIFLDNARTE